MIMFSVCMKATSYLCYILVALTMVSALVGIFYTTGGERFQVTNIYGETIELYGDGIYGYDSTLAVGANKGTDFVMLMVSLALVFVTINQRRDKRYRFVQVGLLAGLLYYTVCLAFGVTFNRLFLVYVLQFSASLFTTVLALAQLIKEDNLSAKLQAQTLKGTAIFLIICGCSVLMWLEFIIPVVFRGESYAHIEIYTTEPTFILDLAIILPVYIGCGIALLRRKTIGYKLAPSLLVLITIVGLMVISQTVFQSSMGLVIPIRQLFGLVIFFVVLGALATMLNMRLFREIARR